MDGLPFYHVPGGTAYMDCQCCANNGSLPLMGKQPTEPMFRSLNEAASPYDLNNYIMQYARNCSPLSLTAPLELSSRSPPLIDMVQAAEQLAALNSGSYYAAEYPGLASSSKSYDARYDSTSPEEIDSLFRRPVPEFKDSPNCSRLSSADILQPICNGEVRFPGVTASNVAHGQGMIPHSNQEDEELTMATALEMEKILRDHFQGASEPSSHPCTTTSLRSWASTYNPNSTWTRELMDPPLVESTWPSSSQVECNMSSGRSQSGLPIQQLAPLGSSQELTLWRPAFNRPAEGTRTVGEFKGKRKLQETSPLAGECELYQGPSPLFCATPSGGVQSMSMGGSEPPRLGKPKKRRTRNRKGDSAGETQRMTHIAVERNRRRQMNDHLRTLKDLMPSGFVQKTDQASIIGAAVEFVKRLEVIADSLLSKQKIRRTALAGIPDSSQWSWLNIEPRPPLSAGASSSAAGCPPSQLSAVTTSQPRHSVYQLPSKRTIMSPELLSVLPQNPSVNNEIKVESRSDAAMIEVKLLESDARVEILTHRRAEQVVKLIVAMESLDLTVLYTEVTAKPNNAVFYKFEAEVGPERWMTAGQIAAALHQTFVDNIHTNYASSPSGI